MTVAVLDDLRQELARARKERDAAQAERLNEAKEVVLLRGSLASAILERDKARVERDDLQRQLDVAHKSASETESTSVELRAWKEGAKRANFNLGDYERDKVLTLFCGECGRGDGFHLGSCSKARDGSAKEPGAVDCWCGKVELLRELEAVVEGVTHTRQGCRRVPKEIAVIVEAFEDEIIRKISDAVTDLRDLLEKELG